MAFRFEQKVLFKHCDPAGIVFYPRYFEMMNDAVEEFFSAILKAPFEKLLMNGGVPTARIECTFSAPSRHGDNLEVMLICARLGRSSLDLKYQAVCASQTRFNATSTLVYISKTGKPVSWPDHVRAALQQQIQGDA